MNFIIYLKKRTGERVTRMAKSLQRSRNSIINEALEEWLDNHTQTQWPKTFFDFTPVEDIPDFKSFREELKDNVSEGPLA